MKGEQAQAGYCTRKPLNFKIQKTFLLDWSVSTEKNPPASGLRDCVSLAASVLGAAGECSEKSYLTCMEITHRLLSALYPVPAVSHV